MHACRDIKTLLINSRDMILNVCYTTSMTSSIVTKASWCCINYMAWKKPKSNTFILGLFDGCLIMRISKLSCWAAFTNWRSWISMWGLALSCWREIGLVWRSTELSGLWNQITSNTLSMRIFRYTTLSTTTYLVTVVPWGQYLLLLYAGSYATKGHKPSLPSNQIFQ